jgi:alpha-tubulin suppressor-like RCC1 family protein
VKEVSAGDAHAALISTESKLYTWGSNHKGQLGHHQPNIGEVPLLKSALVSCGYEYTITLTTTGELVLAGAIPFKVNNKSYLPKFEQLAKFEDDVTVY